MRESPRVVRARSWPLLAILACAYAAAAEMPGSVADNLAAQKLNPLAFGINLPVQVSLGYGYGPRHAVQPTINLQPLIPFGVSEDWRIVTRSNVPIVHLPGPDESTGLGDIDVSVFVTPQRTGNWVWGAGPIVQAPSATRPALGAGKWSAGPTAALLYVDGPWVNGVLASHLRSFAGASGRETVSLTQVEVQLSYTFSSNWYVQTNPNASYNWRAAGGNRWTVPLGVDVGRALKIGAQALSLQLGAYANVKKPAEAADWILQAQFALLY